MERAVLRVAASVRAEPLGSDNLVASGRRRQVWLKTSWFSEVQLHWFHMQVLEAMDAGPAAVD